MASQWKLERKRKQERKAKREMDRVHQGSQGQRSGLSIAEWWEKPQTKSNYGSRRQTQVPGGTGRPHLLSRLVTFKVITALKNLATSHHNYSMIFPASFWSYFLLFIYSVPRCLQREKEETEGSNKKQRKTEVKS